MEFDFRYPLSLFAVNFLRNSEIFSLSVALIWNVCYLNSSKIIDYCLISRRYSSYDNNTLLFINLRKTRHVFVKHGCPRRQQSQIWQKSLSPTFWPHPTPRGMWCQFKCEESIDELTVQVWLLYHHPNFRYCTLLVSGTELRTDRRTDGRTNGRTDGQTDDPITRLKWKV